MSYLELKNPINRRSDEIIFYVITGSWKNAKMFCRYRKLNLLWQSQPDLNVTSVGYFVVSKMMLLMITKPHVFVVQCMLVKQAAQLKLVCLSSKFEVLFQHIAVWLGIKRNLVIRLYTAPFNKLSKTLTEKYVQFRYLIGLPPLKSPQQKNPFDQFTNPVPL